MKQLLLLTALMTSPCAIGHTGATSPVGRWRPQIAVRKGHALSEEQGLLQDARLAIAKDGSFRFGPYWNQADMTWHGTWHATKSGLVLTFIHIGAVLREKAPGGQLQPKRWDVVQKDGRLFVSVKKNHNIIVFVRDAAKKRH